MYRRNRERYGVSRATAGELPRRLPRAGRGGAAVGRHLPRAVPPTTGTALRRTRR